MGRARLPDGPVGQRQHDPARAGQGKPLAAVHFICHTNLVDEFRRLYPDALRYAGNRSIVLDGSERTDEAALRHCIALALTYHARKTGARAAP